MSFDILGLGVGPVHPSLSLSSSQPLSDAPPNEDKTGKKKKKKDKSNESADTDAKDKSSKKKSSKSKAQLNESEFDSLEPATRARSGASIGEPVKKKNKKKKDKKRKNAASNDGSASDASDSGSLSDSDSASDSVEFSVSLGELGLDEPSGGEIDDQLDSEAEAEAEAEAAPQLTGPWFELPASSDPRDFHTGSRRVLSSFDRFDWLERQLDLRQNEFTEHKKLKFYIGTWNLNGKKYKSEEALDDWLLQEVEAGAGVANVYCIGFQEIVDLNAQTLFVDHSAAEPWEAAILQTLSRTGKRFIQIASVHLVGLAMCVFVRAEHVQHVTDIRSSTVGVGIMGVGGNKGAVVVRFNLYKSSICFVNAHLAAHQKNFKARNSDYHNILRKCILMPKNADRKFPKYRDETNRRKMQQTHVVLDADGEREDEEEEEGKAATKAAPAQGKTKIASELDSVKSSMWAGFNALKNKIADQLDIQGLASKAGLASAVGLSDPPEGSLTIYDHDHIVWLGDLNYRMDVQELGMDVTCSLIANRNWKTLLLYDQLIAQKKQRNAFVGFHEGKIQFAPTYKFIPGTDQYDRREDKKIRYPAYTDRIQWCSNEEEAVKLRVYTSAPLKLSDHKPVLALLEFPIKAEIAARKQALKSQLEKLSDKQCQTVRMEFSTADLSLSDLIRFDMPVHCKFSALNRSTAALQFKVTTADQDELQGLDSKFDSLDWNPEGEFESEEKNIFLSAGSGGSNFLSQSSASAIGRFNQFPHWISVHPKEGVIAPDSAQSFSVTILVDRRSAHSFNLQPEDFPSIAIRTDSGKRFLLPIKAKYLKSSLGANLSYLLQLQGPIRGVAAAADSVLDYYSKGFSKKTGIPMEVFRLVERISQHSNHFKSKNIWQMPTFAEKTSKAGKSLGFDYNKMAGPPQVRYIAECLDTGRNFDNVPGEKGKEKSESAKVLNARAGEVDLRTTLVRLPVNFFVSALLYWLHSLQRPIFFLPPDSAAALNALPLSAGTAFASSAPAPDCESWCAQAALDLPSESSRVFQYFLAFFRQILTERQENGLTPDGLLECFAECLSHRPPKKPFNQKVPWTPLEILKSFVENNQL